MISSLFAAILTSMLHVISGPDHLAAVTPLAIESDKKAWKVGLAWGFGHLSGMLLIGLLFFLFKNFIPITKISEHSEKLVGVVLIGVGLFAFYRIFNEQKTHTHTHIHTDGNPIIHTHKHEHHHENHKHAHNKKIKQNIFSSFGIGFIHGLAGIAHFILLLPVLSFDSNFEGIQYIIGFGIGTVLAMTAYTLVLGKISGISKQQHNNSFFSGIRLAGGLFAIIIGIYWLVFSL